MSQAERAAARPLTRIHIGVFAHNEAPRIAAAIEDIARQDLFGDPALTVRVFVLANGCTDATARVARQAVRQLPHRLASRITVLELPQGGKSRTWNHFVHGWCTGVAELAYCVDGDIRIPAPDTFSRMLRHLRASGACIACSRPRKDIEFAPGRLPLVERAILMASGTASDYRNSIAGSLYLARVADLEAIHMPVGLPVEDGFLRAMVLTRLLTEPEDFGRIVGDARIWHVYQSLRTVPALLRHQTRLVIGSAINTAMFDHLCTHATGLAARSALLQEAAADERWLGRMLRERLPRWPSGFVPVHFLVKRVQGLRAGEHLGAARVLLVATLGLAFDLLVYLNAQLQMARGKGAGHW
jgi:hypothetical protein